MENQNSRWEKLYSYRRRWLLLLLLLIVGVLVWYIYGSVQKCNRAEQHIEEQFLKKMNEVHFHHAKFALSGLESYLSEDVSEFVKRKNLEWVAKDLDGIVIGNYMRDFGRYYHYIDDESDFYSDAYEALFTTYANLARMWSESETLPERATVELFREEVARLHNFFKVSATGKVDPEVDSQVAGRSTYRGFDTALKELIDQIELPYIKENLHEWVYEYAGIESPSID
ncbi:hypothetical protein ACR6HW_13100 [Fusibacter sp. JL298sf-3]